MFHSLSKGPPQEDLGASLRPGIISVGLPLTGPQACGRTPETDPGSEGRLNAEDQRPSSPRPASRFPTLEDRSLPGVAPPLGHVV